MMPDLLKQYLETRNRTTELCAPLLIEDYIPQAVDFTSPPKWHLAHTSWFFEEIILSKYLHDYRIFDEAYSFLFNSYYNHIGEIFPRNKRGMMTRPSVEEVYRYRKHVDESISTLLNDSHPDEAKKLLMLGINHEQQHQELLLTDLKYTLALNPTFPVYDANSNLVNDENESTGWLNISEGIYDIGHHSDGFSFDNESGRHQVFLHDFEISESLLTNGEYIDFIADGSYDNFRYWLDDGWAWGKRWEWTNSAYLPYPGFKIAAGAVGEYNGKFMLNQMVLRGGSVATAAGHSRHTYRNFFHPQSQWQFSGIRLAR